MPNVLLVNLLQNWKLTDNLFRFQAVVSHKKKMFTLCNTIWHFSPTFLTGMSCSRGYEDNQIVHIVHLYITYNKKMVWSISMKYRLTCEPAHVCKHMHMYVCKHMYMYVCKLMYMYVCRNVYIWWNNSCKNQSKS